MKIAQFRNIPYNYIGVWERQPITDGWVQISGWIDVDFPPLSEKEQRISDELGALATRQKTFEEDFRRQRKALEDEREALLKTGT